MAQAAMAPARDGLSLATALAAFSPQQLRQLLRARPDLATPAPKDLTTVATRASTWASVSACMATLSRGALDLVDALALLPRPTTVDALVRTLHVELDATELDATLDQLAGLGLVFRSGQLLRLHPQLDHLQYPAGLGPPAAELLSKHQGPELSAMAKRLGLNPGRSRQDAIGALAIGLGDRQVLVRALVGSPAGTQALLTHLVVHPVETAPFGTYNVKADTPLGWLTQRGLVIAATWSEFVMPREVGLALRGGRPFADFTLRAPEATWRPVDASSVDRSGLEAAQRLVADVTTLLDAWQVAPPKLLKAGGLGVRELRRAAAATGRSEIDAARVIDLAAAAGLAGWDEAMTVALPRPAYDGWLELGIAERWLTVAAAWLDAEVHVNLAGELETADKRIPPLLDRWPEAPARFRRQLVLDALLEGGAGQAAVAESLQARVGWQAPVMWSGGPARPDMLVSWVREEATMLGVCAEGALTSLGRALVTGRAEEAIATMAAATPRITSEFVIQADLTAVATGPLTTTVRHHLELMADLESSGSATVYRFGEQSLGRAFDEGWTVDAIAGFLDAHATKGVPQPLTYLVEDVGRRHGRLRVGSATCYVRSDDPSLLAEIRLGRRTAKLGLRPLAPTVLVSGAPPETVAATLRAGGFLPVEEDGTGGLLVRRPEVVRASGGFATRSKLGNVPAVPATADSGGEPAVIRAAADGPVDADLDRLVDRLLASRPTASAPRPKPKPKPSLSAVSAGPARPAAVAATAGSRGTSAPASPSARPSGITARTEEIVDLLRLSCQEGWWLRLEYANKDLKRRQVNVVVLEVADEDHAVVYESPGDVTQTLAVRRVTWARALTEAEEATL